MQRVCEVFLFYVPLKVLVVQIYVSELLIVEVYLKSTSIKKSI